MNDYRITFTPEGREETETARITERTEAAARKAFVKRFGKEAELHDIELAAVNTAATKEQERETLEKIKQMVAELGPQSYIATAFDGCFEIAEQNIDDDAADSMKGRFEIEAQRAIERGYEVDRLKAEIKRLNSGIDELIQKDDERKATLERLEAKQLSVSLHSAIYGLAAEELANAQKRMEQAAEIMAELADVPQDIAFTAAVQSYRAAKVRRGACEQIIAGLEALTE